MVGLGREMKGWRGTMCKMVGLGREMKGRGDHVLKGWFGSRDERVEGDRV